MVGNDIIDIKQTRLDTNWRRPGFIQKIFNRQERRLIEQAVDPFHIIWRLWSMKESAYKLYLQLNPLQARFFNPSNFICKLHSESSGAVNFHETIMTTHTQSNSNYIFTYAERIASKRVDTNIFYLSQSDVISQSTCAREKLLEHMCNTQDIERDHLEIRKTLRGIPRIYYNNTALPINISITHQGNYGAFSITKN